MKILHVTNNYPSSNFPIYGIFVKEQIDSLENIGLNCDIFFINAREKGAIEYFRSIFLLVNKIKKNSYELIHCHHTFSAFILFIASFFIRKRSKYIVSFQCDPKKELYGLLYFFISLKFDAYIYKNELPSNDLNNFYLPNGVNKELFREIPKQTALKELSLNPKKIYILFVSSNKIRRQKRYDIFCKTVDILKNKYDLKDLKILKIFNVNRIKVPYYFNASSIHLLTSDFEGSPNSVKESIFCNTPVVSTNVGNVKDILSGINGCYISNTNKAEELALLVNKAINISNFKGREILIEKGFDIDNIAKKLFNIYKKIIKK